MKRNLIRLFSSVICCLMFVAAVPLANATATRASNYFWVTEVWGTPLSDGEIAIEFDVGSTHTMQQLGATEIVIWEQQNNGSYEDVKTFSGGMLDRNTTSAYRMVTYQGTSGTKYYATIAFYAKDSEGSEYLYRNTSIFTA